MINLKNLNHVGNLKNQDGSHLTSENIYNKLYFQNDDCDDANELGMMFVRSYFNYPHRKICLHFWVLLNVQMPGQCTSAPNQNFTKKEMEFLELRQRLKDYIRDELKKEHAGAASVCDNSQEKKKPFSNNYGSFFGHSQPSIARRFLQESKTMVEVQQLAAKLMNSHHSKKNSHVSIASKANSGLLQGKITAQMLKASRDYSSIFSDHAENLSSTVPTGTILKANQKHPSSGLQRVSFSNSIKPEHVTPRKMNYDQFKKAKLKPNQLQFPKDKAPPEKHSISMPKLQEITEGDLEQNRKFNEASCNAKVMQKQVKTATRHHHTPDKHKASFPRSSIGGKRKSEEEIEFVQTKKAKVMQNHPQSSVKDLRKPGKEKAISAQAKSLSKHQINRPMQELCHDDSYISSLCQSLFRRNHTKHVENYDYDDDDECMVSNFNDIQKEERKSAKIAREEDRIEQLRLEQEEKERLRITVKKQKQHHN
ncbi:hypothetical protein Ddye_001355 [Dipteronia dyeriana]|uniref:Protein SPT2 homolog n=1 Tax=Dipteronia dyeriana TaxID=168575 RepID=A0AAD9XNX3_9ROSI|nr:hypothetical protein Ddye_001355 [Dipteronia dyeriana]